MLEHMPATPTGRPCGRTSTWWSLGDTLAHKVGKRECIYISEAGKENTKRGQIVRDKCLNLGRWHWGGKGVS